MPLTHTFPPALVFKTPRGYMVGVSAHIEIEECEKAEKSFVDFRYAVRVTAPDGAEAANYKGELKSLAEEKITLDPATQALYPGATHTIRNVFEGPKQVVLNPEQAAALEAERARVLAQTEEGRALVRAQQARDARRAEIEAERKRIEQERAVPLLHIHGSYGIERELAWGWRMTDEECIDAGCEVGRVIPVPEGARVDLDELSLQYLIKYLKEKGLTPHGWTWGGGRTFRLTAEQWAELEAANRAAKEERERLAAQAQAEAEAKEQAAFEAAKESGKPQELESWVGDDYSVPDSSFSIFTVLAMPDGSKKTTKTPAY